jgi:hypothetical protein
MKRKIKPRRLPKLWQRDRGGVKFGSWHVYVKNRPINLHTKDVEIAKKRRGLALGGQQDFRDDAQGAAADAIAALGEVAPQPQILNPGEPQVPPATAQPGLRAAAPSPEMGAPAAPETIEPEPIPQSEQSTAGWADDVSAAAGASTGDAGATAEAPRLRLADFAWFKAALVTGSKVAVGLQLHAQAWAMRLVGDVEAGRVGPPPSVREPDSPESMAAFMKIASAPWDERDPREPGRQAYERTIVALIPEELPVPAWLKWFEAPVITALNTAPIQWQTGQKIKRGPDGAPEQPPQPTETPAVGAAA